MKRRVGFIMVVVLMVALFWTGFIFSPAQPQARSVVPIEGATFNPSLSLADNLKIYIGKNVFVHLKSGKTLQGYVKAIGNNIVHLEKLAGKDFYDALIRIDEICAMEAKFREMK